MPIALFALMGRTVGVVLTVLLVGWYTHLHAFVGLWALVSFALLMLYIVAWAYELGHWHVYVSALMIGRCRGCWHLLHTFPGIYCISVCLP